MPHCCLTVLGCLRMQAAGATGVAWTMKNFTHFERACTLSGSLIPQQTMEKVGSVIIKTISIFTMFSIRTTPVSINRAVKIEAKASEQQQDPWLCILQNIALLRTERTDSHLMFFLDAILYAKYFCGLHDIELCKEFNQQNTWEIHGKILGPEFIPNAVSVFNSNLTKKVVGST